MYIDRYYTEENDDVNTLTENGYWVYKKAVYEHLKTHLVEALLQEIECERLAPGSRDRNRIQLCLQSLSDLEDFSGTKFFSRTVEKLILANSAVFYDLCAEDLAKRTGFLSYIENTEALYMNEGKQADSMLLQRTKERLLDTLIERLLGLHYRRFLRGNEPFLLKLFSRGEFRGIAQMYRLYQKQKGSTLGAQCIARTFGVYISNQLHLATNTPNRETMEIPKKDEENAKKNEKSSEREVKSPKKDEKWAKNQTKRFKTEKGTQLELERKALDKTLKREREICLRVAKEVKKSRKVASVAFQDDEAVLKELDNAVESFLNEQCLLPRALALSYNAFVVLKDNQSRSSPCLGYRKYFTSDVDLEDFIELEKYVRDKNLFDKISCVLAYERMLNQNINAKMIEKLSLRLDSSKGSPCWIGFHQEVLKELSESKETTTEWHKKGGDERINPRVLPSKAWPKMPTTDFELPSMLKDALEGFEKQFSEQKLKKKLQWRLDQGRANVKILFAPGNERLVNVTTIQMLVLLLFSGKRKAISLEEIQWRTRVPVRLLYYHLFFLCAPQSPILRRVSCESEGCVLEEDTHLALNEKFRGNGAVSFEMMALPTVIAPFFSEAFDLFCKSSSRRSPRSSLALFSDFGAPSELLEELKEKYNVNESVLPYWNNREITCPEEIRSEEGEKSEEELIKEKSAVFVTAQAPEANFCEHIDSVVLRNLKKNKKMNVKMMLLKVKSKLRRKGVRVCNAEVMCRVDDLVEKNCLRYDRNKNSLFFVP